MLGRGISLVKSKICDQLGDKFGDQLRDMVMRSKRAGEREYGQTFCRKGDKLEYIKSECVGSECEISANEIRLCDRDNTSVFVHTHPGEEMGVLSDADVKAAKVMKMSAICAIGNDGLSMMCMDGIQKLKGEDLLTLDQLNQKIRGETDWQYLKTGYDEISADTVLTTEWILFDEFAKKVPRVSLCRRVLK